MLCHFYTDSLVGLFFLHFSARGGEIGKPVGFSGGCGWGSLVLICGRGVNYSIKFFFLLYLVFFVPF